MMSEKVCGAIQEALQQLHQERARIEGAIDNLEGFLTGLVDEHRAELRYGPPAGDAPAARPEVTRLVPRQRSRAGWTPEARLAAAERMRQYWAQRREGVAAPRGRRGRPDASARGEGVERAAPAPNPSPGSTPASDPSRPFWRDDSVRRAVSG